MKNVLINILHFFGVEIQTKWIFIYFENSLPYEYIAYSKEDARTFSKVCKTFGVKFDVYAE